MIHYIHLGAYEMVRLCDLNHISLITNDLAYLCMYLFAFIDFLFGEFVSLNYKKPLYFGYQHLDLKIVSFLYYVGSLFTFLVISVFFFNFIY